MTRVAHAQPGTKRAAIYPRVSSTQQEDDGTSLGTQESACLQFAAERGFTVEPEHVYREVFTGVELWARPQLTRLREAIRRREIDVVIAYAIDRLSRDPVHLGVILSEAEHAGVEVLFVTEPLDYSPEGQLIRFVRGYAAKVEHEKLKERTLRGHLARVRSGKLRVGAKALYGYRWRDDAKSAYDVDDATARIVRRIYRALIEEGHSLRQIARGLNEAGIPTPSGRGRWMQTTIAELLHHPGYKGRAYAWRWKITKAGGRVHRVETRPESEWIELPEGTIPAIVDEATWNAAQSMLERNKRKAAARTLRPETHLLRGGYVVCGNCGWPMTAGYGDDGAPVYHCRVRHIRPGYCTTGATIRAHLLDRAVWQKVELVLTRPEIIRHELQQLRREDPSEDDLAAVDRALADITRQQRNLVDQLAHLGGAVATLVTEKLAGLERQQAQLTQEREAILARRASWQSTVERMDALEQWCQTVRERLARPSYEQSRLALDALGIHVKVYRRDHEPRFDIRTAIHLDGIPLNGVDASGTTCSAVRQHPIVLRWTDRDCTVKLAPSLRPAGGTSAGT